MTNYFFSLLFIIFLFPVALIAQPVETEEVKRQSYFSFYPFFGYHVIGNHDTLPHGDLANGKGKTIGLGAEFHLNKRMSIFIQHGMTNTPLDYFSSVWGGLSYRLVQRERLELIFSASLYTNYRENEVYPAIGLATQFNFPEKGNTSQDKKFSHGIRTSGLIGTHDTLYSMSLHTNVFPSNYYRLVELSSTDIHPGLYPKIYINPKYVYVYKRREIDLPKPKNDHEVAISELTELGILDIKKESSLLGDSSVSYLEMLKSLIFTLNLLGEGDSLEPTLNISGTHTSKDTDGLSVRVAWIDSKLDKKRTLKTLDNPSSSFTENVQSSIFHQMPEGVPQKVEAQLLKDGKVISHTHSNVTVVTHNIPAPSDVVDKYQTDTPFFLEEYVLAYSENLGLLDDDKESKDTVSYQEFVNFIKRLDKRKRLNFERYLDPSKDKNNKNILSRSELAIVLDRILKNRPYRFDSSEEIFEVVVRQEAPKLKVISVQKDYILVMGHFLVESNARLCIRKKLAPYNIKTEIKRHGIYYRIEQLENLPIGQILEIKKFLQKYNVDSYIIRNKLPDIRP